MRTEEEIKAEISRMAECVTNWTDKQLFFEQTEKPVLVDACKRAVHCANEAIVALSWVLEGDN